MPETDKSSRDKKHYTYKSSGVDIDKASNTLNQLKGTINRTFSANVLSDLSSFSSLFELDLDGYKKPVLVSATDGVGTKILLCREADDYRHIGQDLVAMSINDLLCSGARPMFFLDYIACGKIDPVKIKTIITSIAGSCKICKTALVGGETAEMPGMYQRDDIDLAGFAVGIVDKPDIINKARVRKNDILVGISSSGFHSNGYSLLRKIINDKKLGLNKKYSWTGGKDLAEVLLAPTRLYCRIINELLYKNKIGIHGIAHITGGGFYDNIARIIPPGLDAVLDKGSWEVPRIFRQIQKLGNIDSEEMYKVFNMGIGMVLIISPGDLGKVVEIARDSKEAIFSIGEIKEGQGKVIIGNGRGIS